MQQPRAFSGAWCMSARSFILVVVLHMITNAIGSLRCHCLSGKPETIGGSFILLIVAGPVLLFRERRGFYAAMRDDTKEGRRIHRHFNVGFLFMCFWWLPLWSVWHTAVNCRFYGIIRLIGDR